MTQSFVQVPPDSTGKKLLTQQHTTGVGTAQAPVSHLADPDNPAYMQHVDPRGAAFVRFSEGSPLADGFGNLKVSTTTCIGNYDHVVDDSADLFSDATVGGGAVTYISAASTMNLSVGSALGDAASRVSNKHHYYLPGTSNLVMMTIALSDSGKVGCSRSWGAFDDVGGLKFTLDEAEVLKVCTLSSVTGSPVLTSTPRSEWNGDKLDGTGLSGFTLDITKLNIYWIDYQWLGGGRVRFGVVDDFGNRVVCHTTLNANHNLYPYTPTGSLPIGVSIKNIALTGGASSIRFTCASVHAEGDVKYTFWRYQHAFPTKAVSAPNTYLLAIKSLQEFGGKHNTTVAYPESLSCYVTGGVLKLDLIWDYLPLATPTWALDNGSTVIGDTAGTPTIAGDEYQPKSWYLEAGAHDLDLARYFEKTDIGLTLQQNGTEAIYVMLVASVVSGSPSIQGILEYAEMR